MSKSKSTAKKPAAPRTHPSTFIGCIEGRCDLEGGCWIWTGPLKGGVPRFRGRYVSHTVFELSYPHEPRAGRQLHTSCGNPLCVSPEHLAFGRFIKPGPIADVAADDPSDDEPPFVHRLVAVGEWGGISCVGTAGRSVFDGWWRA